MSQRIMTLERNTTETQITLGLNLDARGQQAAELDLPVPFLAHMLDSFARHSGFGLSVKATGDTHVDDHHLVEDTGLVLGQALLQALGDKKGITRFAQAVVPMDETLVLAAVDLSGRPYLAWNMDIPLTHVGSFDTALALEFFRAFTMEAKMNLHLRQLAGENAHHLIEAAFKATARALAVAVSPDKLRGGGVPSTKGSLV